MTIQALARLVRRHFVIIGVFLVLGLGAGFGATQVMPKTYSATTIQFVRGIPGTGTGAEYQAAQFAASRAKSYPVMIGNPDLLTAVITELGLNMSTTELASMLTVDNPTDTSVINVTARASTPELAQSISVSAADNLAKLILRLESAGTNGKSPVDIQTAVPALKPTSPTSPKLSVNVGLGGAVGLALGLLAALALDARRQRAKSARVGRHVDDVLPGSTTVEAAEPRRDELDGQLEPSWPASSGPVVEPEPEPEPEPQVEPEPEPEPEPDAERDPEPEDLPAEPVAQIAAPAPSSGGSGGGGPRKSAAQRKMAAARRGRRSP